MFKYHFEQGVEEMTDHGQMRQGLLAEVTMVRCRGCGEMLNVRHSTGRRQSVTLYRMGCPIPSCGRVQHVGLISEYIGVECAQAVVSPAGS
jgi:hypothetical protein